MLLYFLFIIGVIFITNVNSTLIDKFPNTTFRYDHQQYSGYLKANDKGTWKLFYWLLESQNNPNTDPLLLWLDGGPGCSSVSGAFNQLSPFYIDRNSQSLDENMFSWNKYANLLLIESPTGVGYSYDTENFPDPDNYADDDRTAQQNYMALKDFFANVHPQFRNRTFFISGESYAGIYVPTLAKLIVNGIDSGDFINPNFQGIAIGNGYMNVKQLTNSLILWGNYHGITSVDEWDNIKRACCPINSDIDNCDFYSHLSFNLNSDMNGDSDGSLCGNLITTLFNISESVMNWYNYYQDCYETNRVANSRRLYAKVLPILAANSRELNHDSTDDKDGYACLNGATMYLNQNAVLDAFHIDDLWRKRKNVTWQDCNGDMYVKYNVTYLDTSQTFKNIINRVKTPNFQILIYNGDVDLFCNFLGCAWHVRDLASDLDMTKSARMPWIFRGQIGGYVQRYSVEKKATVNIDVLTIKGAGHLSTYDRQGPSLQMIANFLKLQSNYSSTDGIDTMPTTNDLITTTSNANIRANLINMLIIALVIGLLPNINLANS